MLYNMFLVFRLLKYEGFHYTAVYLQFTQC
jgi:hypothetical protein